MDDNSESVLNLEEKLRQISAEAAAKKGVLSNEELMAYFAGVLLTPDQLDHVYEYLENVVGDTIVTTRRTLTVEKITEIDEKYLELVDWRAMAVVTSETYNAAGEMFEYTQSRHRPDMFAFYSVARRRNK